MAAHSPMRRKSLAQCADRRKHAEPRGPAPLQRPLPRHGHECGRRLQPLARPGRHPLARGHAPATTGAAFCYLRDLDSGDFWSTAYQPTLARADSYEAIFSQGRAEFRRRDHGLRDVHRDHRLAGRRHRVAPGTHHEPRARAPDHRADQLRGGRAGAAGCRRDPALVRQPVRADRDHPRTAGDPLHAAAALRRRARAVVVPPAGRAVARRHRRVLRDRPDAVHRARAHGRRTRTRSTGLLRFQTARVRCSTRSSRSAAALRSSRESRRRSTSCPAPAAAARPASALIEKYQDRHLADRVFDLAWTHSSVMLARSTRPTPTHSSTGAWRAPCFTAMRRCAPSPACCIRIAAGNPAFGVTPFPATCRSCC